MEHCHGRARGTDPLRTRAEVIARWEDRRVLLRLADGPTVAAEVPAQLQSRYDVGDSAWVQLAADGTVVTWGLCTG